MHFEKWQKNQLILKSLGQARKKVIGIISNLQLDFDSVLPDYKSYSENVAVISQTNPGNIAKCDY